MELLGSIGRGVEAPDSQSDAAESAMRRWIEKKCFQFTVRAHCTYFVRLWLLSPTAVSIGSDAARKTP